MAIFNFGMTNPAREEENLAFQLLDINDTLGPLYSSILLAWPGANAYFRQNWERHLEEETPVVGDSLESLFNQYKPDDIDDEEAKVITTLIHQVLKYEPLERPSARELLEHPWFKD